MRILLLEDNEVDALLTVAMLREQGLEFEWQRVETAPAFSACLELGFDAVIADYHVPGFDVRTALEMARERLPDVPFLVVSGVMSADEGVELMRLGAEDYLSKERLQRLGPALLQSCDRARQRQEARLMESRYRTLFEQLPVGVVRSSPSGETLEINPALLRIMRFPDEATYRRETSLLKTEFISDAMRTEMVAALARDGIVNGFETEVKRRDGTSGWIRLDISAIEGPDGTLTSVDAVVTDIDDRRRAEAARHAALDDLRWSDTQRRRLLKQVITAQEEERQRIAQGIHDDAVQVLSAANIRLAMLGQKLNDDKLSSEVDRLIDAISMSTGRLRDLLFELQPPALERGGLMAALQSQLRMLDRDAALECQLTGEVPREPSPERGILIYRIAQEAFANIRKHARARHVEVSVCDQDDGILVRIHDDGRGFQPGERGAVTEPGHLGLASMTERATLVGGWCGIESSPGAGATISLWVPSRESSVSSAAV